MKEEIYEMFESYDICKLDINNYIGIWINIPNVLRQMPIMKVINIII